MNLPNPFSNRLNRRVAAAILLTFTVVSRAVEPVRYLDLPPPQTIDWPAQSWEGDQQPHTLSVVELNRDGYRYWGWYGLNHGRGIGLARSNDLIHWAKYAGNPLWTNARWPSVVRGAGADSSGTLYFAVTRDYDTPSSHIVLASSTDGKQLTEVKTLVPAAAQPRNQNPNLIWDEGTRRYILTFYRGNDQDYFDIVSRSANSALDLDRAEESVLIHSRETVAAPTLLYLPRGGPARRPVYYLATEIYPNRYDKSKAGDWQVQVYYSYRAGGPFRVVTGNPVQRDGRACLFQHVFNRTFYGYQSHLGPHDLWSMEVLVVPLGR